MSAEAKALLDELMGRTRNLDPTQNHADISWSSDDVCKYFLCGFCPNELFTNTRADLGPCHKIHDDAFRQEYQKSPRFEKCGYEEDFMRFLQNLITDVEKRIKRGHQRLALNSQATPINGTLGNQNEDKVKLLTEKINELLEQTETLGCEGKVEEAQGVMKLADQLKEERTQLESQPVQNDLPMMKQMEVCDVCGAFLIVGDAPQRQDEHLMGKQHAGYAQVRAEIEKRKKKARDEMEAREASEIKMKQEREEREKERQRERDERRQKERDREREREKDRGSRRRRSRSRSRDHNRSRRRSSSRDRRRGRRSRSRSRDRRRRSRSNSRSRRARRSSSRDRKSSRRHSRERRSRSRHRSRSKDRKERSRDKDSKKRTDDKKDDKGNDKSNGNLSKEGADNHMEKDGPKPGDGEPARPAEDKAVDVVCEEGKSESDEPFGGGTNGALQSEGDTKIDE